MTTPEDRNIVWHRGEVSRQDRAEALGQRGVVLWFTGLSGSGKSTVANRVERVLIERGVGAYVLDGDNVRHGLNNDLGFSPDDRRENIRRIGEVAKLFADSGLVTAAAFISPYRNDRDAVRAKLPEGDFVEVHVATPLEVCEARDPKGLYKRARAGEIPQFTGLTAPYEEPLSPELTIRTDLHEVDECAAQVVAWLEERGYCGSKST